MKYSPQKLRPLCKWSGGKNYLARWIVGLLPEHDTYVEPYAGGLSVLLNKPRSAVEVVSDTNAHLINLYKVVQDTSLFPAWYSMLLGTNYSEGAFNLAKIILPPVPTGTNNVSDALMFLVKHRFSRVGEGKKFAIGTRVRGKHRQAGPVPGDINAWDTLKEHVPLLHERLVGVQCYNDKALSVMAKYAGPDAVFYCDPPYPGETRTSPEIYGVHEMTDQDHLDMLNFLVGVQAKGIFLSTYPNRMYESILGPAGWDQTFKDMPNHSGQGATKQRRREVVWFRV